MPADDLQKTDEELALLARTQKEFFGYLVERYATKLGSYARRLGIQSREDAEDVVQETFLKAYENLNDFDTDLSFSSWIYRIAHNQAMTFFRKRRARPEGHRALFDEDDLDRLAGETDVFMEAAVAHDAARIRTVLTELPQQEYEIIVLRFFEHKSYDEISDILSLPPGTVANRLSRAKTRMKRIMTSNGFAYA